MGWERGAARCSVLPQGYNFSNSPDDGCACHCAANYPKPFFPTCSPFPFQESWPERQPEASDADSDHSSQICGCESTPKSNTTRINANLGQVTGASGVYGNHTVVGRQVWKLSNGAIDMRWHFNQGLDYHTYATAQFVPGGLGAIFGFLQYKGTDAWNKYGSGTGGFSRRDPAVGGDPTDKDVYTSDYRFAVNEGTYYYYSSSGNLWISKAINRRGWIVYYDYDPSFPERITKAYTSPSDSRLIAYFHYDSLKHIDRVHLQDAEGSDHRTAYYNYTGGFVYQSSLGNMIDPNGAVTSLSIQSVDAFGTQPYVASETDADGYSTYFVYDTAATDRILRSQWDNRVTYFEDDGSVSSNRLGQNGVKEFSKRTVVATHNFEVDKETDKEGYATYYYFDANKMPTGRRDKRGNLTQWQINSRGMISVTSDPDGSVTYFGYASNALDVVRMQGRRHTSSFDQITYYGYDNRGLRTQILAPLGKTAYFIYDNVGRLTTAIDARANATYHYYDSFGQRTVIQDALLSSSYFAYNANREIIRHQDSLGNTTYYTYDKLDQRLSQQLPTGELTTFAYTNRGLVSRQSAPGNRYTYFGYDAFSNLLREARNTGSGLATTYHQYDDMDNRIVTIDPERNLIQNGFDNRNLKVRSLDSAGYATYYGYDQIGNLAVSLNPQLTASYFGYDAMNRRVRSLDDATLGLATYFSYDRDGNTSFFVDARGYTSYFGYDALNRNIQALNPLLEASYFGYDLSDNITRVVDPIGTTTYYNYDSMSRLCGMLDALSRATYYGYDSIGNRRRVLYPGTQCEYFNYDGSSRLTSQLSRRGFPTYFGFDAAGNVNRQMNPRQNTEYFYFDVLDRQTIRIDALQQPSYFGYDLLSNLTARCDHIESHSAATTYFGYDSLSRLVRKMDALSRTAYYHYDALHNITVGALSGTPIQVTYFGYDSASRLIKLLSPTQSASYFGYDRAGNRTAVLSPRGYATYFNYDALDRITSSLDALNGSSYFGYDSTGNLLRGVDQRGFTTYFSYDSLDRIVTTTTPNQVTVQRSYDISGNVHAIKPASSNATYFGYNADDQLIVVQDGESNSAYFGYDQVGNRTVSVTPRSFATYFNYDALNRLSTVLDAVGATKYFSYDVGGNVASVVDSRGISWFRYDSIDRITSVQTGAAEYGIQEYGGTYYGGLGGTVYFGYDQAGNRNTETDVRSNTTYYTFDVENRLKTEIDPLMRTSYFGYDGESNLTQTCDKNGVTTYFGYDGLNRCISIEYPTQSQYFGYDPINNLTASLDDWGASYFAYDAVSRLVAQSTPRNDVTYYGYNGDGNVIALQYPSGSISCYYAYDGAQRMSQLLSPYNNACYFTYDASSNVTFKQYGNGVKSIADFDAADRIVSLRYIKSNGLAVAYFEYGRDINGRIIRLDRETDSVVYYTYDGLDRLLLERWSRKSDNSQIYAFTYEYDAAGNRLRMRRETTVGTVFDSTYYSYSEDNSLSKRRNQSSGIDTYYYYDLNGSLTAQVEGSDTTYFEYAANQLVSKVTPPIGDGNAWVFNYDARLNRYKINRGGTIAYLLWDGLNCMEEKDNGGALVARYTYGYSPIYGIGNCVEIYLASTGLTYVLVTDHRGTGHVLLDQNESEIGRRYYDAFGVILGESGSWPVDLSYQTNWQTIKIGNKWWGLSRYRMYDFAIGNFISRDFLPYLNKYRAFSNSPIKQVDRDGLADVDASWQQEFQAFEMLQGLRRGDPFNRKGTLWMTSSVNGQGGIYINDYYYMFHPVQDTFRSSPIGILPLVPWVVTDQLTGNVLTRIEERTAKLAYGLLDAESARLQTQWDALLLWGSIAIPTGGPALAGGALRCVAKTDLGKAILLSASIQSSSIPVGGITPRPIFRGPPFDFYPNIVAPQVIVTAYTPTGILGGRLTIGIGSKALPSGSPQFFTSQNWQGAYAGLKLRRLPSFPTGTFVVNTSGCHAEIVLRSIDIDCIAASNRMCGGCATEMMQRQTIILTDLRPPTMKEISPLLQQDIPAQPPKPIDLPWLPK